MEENIDNSTSNTSDNNTIDYGNLSSVRLPYSFQFWFLLICEIPSLICYVLVFTYILTHKTQRQALHNHSIMVLLFIGFCMVLIDYSWTVDSCLHQGTVWLSSPLLCEVWWLLDFGFYNSCAVILAWSSFERHILIFHSHLIATKRKRFYIHYCPLMFIITYLLIFYVYVIFFPSCENQYDFNSPVCGAYPCYLTIRFIALWDWTVHGSTPTLLIVLFNVLLIVRVLWQKRRHHQDWKRYRKMARSLLSIAVLYLSINLPQMIIFTVQLAGYPEWGVQAQLYLFFFSTLVQFLLPFVYVLYLPNIWLETKILFGRGRQRIMPMTLGRTIGEA